MSQQIFRFGPAKQFARREDGQWFYRIKKPLYGRWGRWLPAPAGRPDGAWYDPSAGRAQLPNF